MHTVSKESLHLVEFKSALSEGKSVAEIEGVNVWTDATSKLEMNEEAPATVEDAGKSEGKRGSTAVVGTTDTGREGKEDRSDSVGNAGRIDSYGNEGRNDSDGNEGIEGGER